MKDFGRLVKRFNAALHEVDPEKIVLQLHGFFLRVGKMKEVEVAAAWRTLQALYGNADIPEREIRAYRDALLDRFRAIHDTEKEARYDTRRQHDLRSRFADMTGESADRFGHD